MLAALLAPLALAAPGVAQADTRVTCRMHAEPPPPGPFESRAGWRASTAHLNGARLQLMSSATPAQVRTHLRDRRVYGWKTPFALTAGGDVIVTITSGDGAFEYTKAKTYGRSPRSVRFTACAADHPLFMDDGVMGPITGWPGGLYTTRRTTCLRMRVTNARDTAERPAQVTVPLGRRSCPKR